MSTPQHAHDPGARWDGQGVHFTLRSRHAVRVELCLFGQPSDPSETHRIDLVRQAPDLWYLFVPDIGPGQLYGFRVHGPWEPSRGHRFDATKLLLDPAATAICGSLEWHPTLRSADPGRIGTAAQLADSAPFVPKCVITDPSFDWQQDRRPAIPWDETVIYECHLRGMTQRHSALPPELRGTYAGLGHEAVLEHLLGLGVTTVELMPIQHFVSEEPLRRLELANYFGYNPIGYFAPHADYASGDRGQQVAEFKSLVRALHGAGLEVVLDVVFNHTAEGNHLGPTFGLRGIDNASYYRLMPEDRSLYQDLSGCGNTLHFGRGLVIDLVLACLRYWVTEMHVDGFRFDLAVALGRQDGEFDPGAGFFRRLAEDPVLAGVKLIAEPWDVGPHGYRLGQFPVGWSEWNDRYRDSVRGFWRGDTGPLQVVTDHLAGSPATFDPARRGASASINFITSHDGFTLEDLVSYEHKHNWANAENNRDGHDHNLSRNWGHEGPTDSAEVQALRQRIKRNFLATLALSRGVPMLSHGDELGRTQLGNNNAYCQDSELTWVNWELSPEQRSQLAFTRKVFKLRRALGISRPASAPETEHWISAHGAELTVADWRRRQSTPFGWLVRRTDSAALLIFNADDSGHLFELPELDRPGRWRQLLSSDQPGVRWPRGRSVRIPARSLMLLTFTPTPPTAAE